MDQVATYKVDRVVGTRHLLCRGAGSFSREAVGSRGPPGHQNLGQRRPVVVEKLQAQTKGRPSPFASPNLSFSICAEFHSYHGIPSLNKQANKKNPLHIAPRESPSIPTITGSDCRLCVPSSQDFSLCHMSADKWNEKIPAHVLSGLMVYGVSSSI